MAADFFERQDVARRKTTRLVILYVLAILAILVSVELLLIVTMGAQPELLVLAAVATLLVVGGGSLYKIAQLRAGGRVIAEELGGRLVTSDTRGPAEQQLLNVVEEMAIASGVPPPPVYVMDQEASINAFAAGFTPNDAVIGVTRGTMERLTRDELQGVIAHEFSHILNGDMRLNIRLIGILHGILIIGMLGYFILRSAMFSGVGRRRSRQEGNPLPLLALGAGLMVVGFFGTVFGNLIKAAVSRQREFLADASAVQFTRQPGGLAGALKKIGGFVAGSRIRSPNAPEASHMFFGRATSGLSGLFSTHPPLPERIRRIEPSWDGTFPEVEADTTRAPMAAAGVAGLAGAKTGVEAQAGGVASPVTRAMDQVGQPGEAHVRYASNLLERLPRAIKHAAHEPYGARAIVYALLLDRAAEPRETQLAHLSAAADPGVYQETLRLAPSIAELDVRTRLPLLDIALPALRALTKTEYERFKQNVVALVKADRQIDLFEWSLSRILLHDLIPHYVKVRPPRVRHRTLASLRSPCELLLSVLAYVGQRDAAGAQQAFEQGWQVTGLPPGRLRRLEDCGLDALDAALATLEEAAPQLKRRVLQGAVSCILANRTVTAAEAELLRAVSASLGCPMPPLLAA